MSEQKIRKFLEAAAVKETGRGVGTLDIVAAMTKLPEYRVREIADGGEMADDEAEVLLALVVLEEA